MNPRIKLTATAHPDEDRMLVEIMIDGEHLAEFVECSDDHEFVLYPKRDGRPWSFPRGLLLEAIVSLGEPDSAEVGEPETRYEVEARARHARPAPSRHRRPIATK